MSASLTKGGRIALAVLLAQCLSSVPWAGASPYTQIAERNIFGLKPKPPETKPEPEPEPEPPPNVKITGIMTIGGIPRALVKVEHPADPKTKTPASEESYIMVAGEPAQGGIQVLQINDSKDPKDVKVKVRQDGKESWLALEKDTVKAAPAKAAPGATPAQAAAAAAHATAAQRLAAARAAAAHRTSRGGAPHSANPAIPSRNIRTAQGGTPGSPGYVPGTTANTIRLGEGTSSTQTRVEHDYGLSPEEQVILIEANREVSVDDVAQGKMPPLPPTPLTPPELDPTTQQPDALDQLQKALDGTQ